MDALKASMAWDERVYGREYDLDVFNIVAVADFNFGAMENKGLNIFNSRYILADPETATDADFDAIAGVVAHEYFHNWSGNRVTCRDWFQLSPEGRLHRLPRPALLGRSGLGRGQADRGRARAARRAIPRGCRPARASGPARKLYRDLATSTPRPIYNKGAEVIRMMRTMLGPEKFRAGTDLYFDRHDGKAATCEDFVARMEEASGVDLDAVPPAGTARPARRASRASAGA